MDANTTTGTAGDGASRRPRLTAQARALLGLPPRYPGAEISPPATGPVAASTAGRARRHLTAPADAGYREPTGTARLRLPAAAQESQDSDPGECTAALERVLDGLPRTAWAAAGTAGAASERLHLDSALPGVEPLPFHDLQAALVSVQQEGAVDRRRGINAVSRRLRNGGAGRVASA